MEKSRIYARALFLPAQIVGGGRGGCLAVNGPGEDSRGGTVKTALRVIVVGVLCLGSVGRAHAVNVGGLSVSPGATFAVTQLYENVPVGTKVYIY